MPTVPAATTVTALSERVDLALSCLAVDHRLGGVLFVGLPLELLPHLGHHLGQMLADDDHGDAETVTLGATRDEDDLWWRPRLTADGGGFQFEAVPGPLIDLPDGPPRTVLIPDLATAGLAVARAAVTVIGADHATSDRHGQHASWRPRTRWLAACARSDLARLSPHLLDRFCVRVAVPEIRQVDWYDRRQIRVAVTGHAPGPPVPFRFPGLPFTGRWRATERLPPMTGEAVEAVLKVLPGPQTGARRDLALARLARAIATVREEDSVRDRHVREAASLIGLNPSGPGSASARSRKDGAGTGPADATRDQAPRRGDDSGSALSDTDAPGSTNEAGPSDGGPEDTGPALLDPASSSALGQRQTYPEDDPGSIAEYAPLRERWQRADRPRARHGHVVGTEPTRHLSDLAVVPTAFEAAKFQPLRRAHGSRTGPGLLIAGPDLRRYRYQPRPDTAVVLVLDHTSHRDWDFAPAIAPYLRWAYVRHAVLSVVECGYQGAANELRASAYRAGSVLDGRLAVSLGRAPGRATPLAHALDIGAQELRRQLRQAEVVAANSWFIVVSDGRGNVPIEASQRGHQLGPVSREGITDALEAARAVRAIGQVHKVVVAPPKLAHYARLPFDLAAAMGGIVAEEIR